MVIQARGRVALGLLGAGAAALATGGAAAGWTAPLSLSTIQGSSARAVVTASWPLEPPRANLALRPISTAAVPVPGSKPEPPGRDEAEASPNGSDADVAGPDAAAETPDTRPEDSVAERPVPERKPEPADSGPDRESAEAEPADESDVRHSEREPVPGDMPAPGALPVPTTTEGASDPEAGLLAAIPGLIGPLDTRARSAAARGTSAPVGGGADSGSGVGDPSDGAAQSLVAEAASARTGPGETVPGAGDAPVSPTEESLRLALAASAGPTGDRVPEAAQTRWTIAFVSGDDALESEAVSTLDDILEALAELPARDLVLMAYAGPDPEAPELDAGEVGADELSAGARRIALNRALTVRDYLVDQGLDSTRLHVRALGDKTKDHPVDRIDFVLVN